MKKRILLVDDEVAFTRMLKLNLERTGNYDVRVENLPDDVVQAVKEFKPDLILLDVIMPHMYGGDVLEKLKSDPDLKNIPVVFLTASVKKQRVIEHEGVISGYPFIAKPATLDEIISTIEKYS